MRGAGIRAASRADDDSGIVDVIKSKTPGDPRCAAAGTGQLAPAPGRPLWTCQRSGAHYFAACTSPVIAVWHACDLAK
jgi:hypothetical protein